MCTGKLIADMSPGASIGPKSSGCPDQVLKKGQWCLPAADKNLKCNGNCGGSGSGSSSGGSGSASSNSGNAGKTGNSASSACRDARGAAYCQGKKASCQKYSSIRNSCKKTCGLCSGKPREPTCKDTHSKGSSYCQEWTSACKDDRYPNFRKRCKKSCGLCKSGKTGGSSCKDTHSKGSSYCRKWKTACTDDKYPNFRNACRKTCGRCN